MTSRKTDDGRGMAQVLGCFSLALGLTELVAPQIFTRAFGLRGKERTIRGLGAREIVSGVGILASGDPQPWIWGRLAGDAVDLAILAGGLKAGGEQRKNAEIALAAVAGVTALDVMCARRLARNGRTQRRHVDYSDRSGLPKPPDQMRGTARDFQAPREYRLVNEMRPFPSA